MARHDFAITAVGRRALNAVVVMLLQRQVDCVQLSAIKHRTEAGELHEIRISVEVAEGDDGGLLVRRLDRLVDVIKVVRCSDRGSTGGSRTAPVGIGSTPPTAGGNQEALTVDEGQPLPRSLAIA